MNKINCIEMLRCLAAILVVFFHTQIIFGNHMPHAPFGGAFSGGSHGVDLFFVLSGFIIGYVHKNDIGQPNRLANYIFNRTARIFPAVWIMTSFALMFYIAGYGGASKAGKIASYNIFASYALLPQLGEALINVTWTLKYEVFFYMIFGTLIISRRLGLVLLIIWQVCALTLGSMFSIRQLGLLGFYSTSICVEFGIGLMCLWALDLMLENYQSVIRNSALLWLFSLTGAFLFVMGLGAGTGAVGVDTHTGNGLIASHAWSVNTPCALGSGILIISLVLLERVGQIKIPKALVFLGNASYSIYIVHFSVAMMVFNLMVRHGIQVNSIICLCVATLEISVGSAFHIFVDKPLQNLLRTKVKPAVRRLYSARIRMASAMA